MAAFIDHTFWRNHFICQIFCTQSISDTGYCRRKRKNNIAIVVPCHRVIGSNGKLVGYAGGLWRKHWLLQHEREVAQKGQTELKF